jgi:hypothetical protein
VADLAPIHARREQLLAHSDQVTDVLASGAAVCRPLARATLAEVRQRMGID